jgi:molybdopterin-guanine dinucleotide biosynthesis protein A
MTVLAATPAAPGPSIGTMPGSAGVVLAGGLSSRMGTPKAALEWHGSTLLWRTAAILARATGGPVVVVRARGQALPALPPGTEVAADPGEGLGPVGGLAAGLAALAGRAEVAFVSATDLPFLHPAFVRRVLRAAADGADVGLPVARGHPQPLAACYRVALAPLAAGLVARGRLRPAFLFERCQVTRLDEIALRADPALAAVDPGLDSLVNVNEPADYQAARARPAPLVTVRWPGPQAGGHGPRQVRAATVAGAAAAAGLDPGGPIIASLNGDPATTDGQAPLVAGDTVTFLPAGPQGGVAALRRGLLG